MLSRAASATSTRIARGSVTRVDGADDTNPNNNALDNEGFELDDDLDFNLAPPTYDEVVNSTRYPIVRSATQASGGSAGGWRLDFVDFTPHLAAAANRQVGNFRNLLKRANTWLASNSDVTVTNCETVTWCATSAEQLNETNLVHRNKSMSSSVKTKYLRGLRLWLTPRTGENHDTVALGMEDFAPNDCDETLSGLVKKVNRLLKERPLQGRLLNIETVWTRSKPGKIYCSATYWQEPAHKPKPYAFFLRFFFVEGPSQPIEFGLKDFLPAQTSESYENFSQVMDKAAHWVSDQANLTVVSLQAVHVKRKGTPQNSHGRLFYTEHPNQVDGRMTYYYQLLRVAYIKSQQEVALVIAFPLQLTKKTFAPALLPPTGEERESRFESFTKTVERVSSWLDSTGADVFAVETVPVRMHAGGPQRHGPEATLLWSQPEQGVKVEDWLIFVRLYVKGPYREPRLQHVHALSMPPIDWHRREHHQPIRRPANRKRNCFIFCILFLLVVIGTFIMMYVAYSFVK